MSPGWALRAVGLLGVDAERGRAMAPVRGAPAGALEGIFRPSRAARPGKSGGYVGGGVGGAPRFPVSGRAASHPPTRRSSSHASSSLRVRCATVIGPDWLEVAGPHLCV